MRAGLPVRILLLAAAVAVAWLAAPWQAALSALVAVALYSAVGQRSTLVRYARPLFLLLAMSAVLWTFVGLDLEAPEWRRVLGGLTAPGAPFAMVVRIAVATLIAALAAGSVPDGHALPLAKSLGLNDNLAVLYAAPFSLVAVIGESFERSIVALRAHGAIRDGQLSLLRGLPQILALTWTSCLDVAMGRAAIKWQRNGFLLPDSPVFALKAEARRDDDVACLIAFTAVAAILLGGSSWP